jgi:hypothetical protein
MMAGGLDADVRQRLVIARVGWCSKYDGSQDDEPRKGGGWNLENVGAEHRNFVPYAGRVYGWVQPPGSRLSLGRVEPAAADQDAIDDVCVAWIATRNGFGQVLVGWYRHTKMFAEYREHGKRGLYEFIANVKDSFLLKPDDRRLQIPKGKGGTGQANMCYARDLSGKLMHGAFFDSIRRTILGYGKRNVPVTRDEALEVADAVVRGQGFQFDVRHRRLIELHAMARVKKLLKKSYGEVEDRSGECSFDYVCRNGTREVLVEVKGTTTHGKVVLLSRAECELAKEERVDLYVVKDIKIEADGKGVRAVGGSITVYKDWGSRKYSARALGFAVLLK